MAHAGWARPPATRYAGWVASPVRGMRKWRATTSHRPPDANCRSAAPHCLRALHRVRVRAADPSGEHRSVGQEFAPLGCRACATGVLLKRLGGHSQSPVLEAFAERAERLRLVVRTAAAKCVGPAAVPANLGAGCIRWRGRSVPAPTPVLAGHCRHGHREGQAWASCHRVIVAILRLIRCN